MKSKDVIINDKLEENKVILIHYLRMKTEEEDWHGVQDAASDLREIELKIKYEEKLNGSIKTSSR